MPIAEVASSIYSLIIANIMSGKAEKVFSTLNKFYTHNVVNHSARQYVNKDAKASFKVDTNTVEGLFGHVRPTIIGTYHWFSNKHTNRYLKEIGFRYSTRKQSDNDRFMSFITNLECRLAYKVLIRAV